MQTIKKLYRTDYLGEDVVKDLVWENGEWKTTAEYVPNNVINNQISNRAVILGNGPSRVQQTQDILPIIKNHKGGLLASGRLQTYGCNALYRDFTPDFLVANGTEIAKEIAESGYCADNIVYSGQDSVLAWPGKFYLVPQNPHWDAGSMAAYLACFDGHKTVYLLGFDCHSGEHDSHYNVYAGTNGYPDYDAPNSEAFYTKSLLLVMNTYSDVEFVRVVPTKYHYTPEQWKYQLNLRQISFNDFVLEADL
jgi:hypothetical protein